ncbi:MAG: hypothetical protein ACKOQP_06360 [Bacteroidota bacterium]
MVWSTKIPFLEGYRLYFVVFAVDQNALNLLDFWSLWENQGSHAVLGPTTVSGWSDRQCAAIMELFHQQRREVPLFGRYVEAIRSESANIRYPDDLVFLPIEAFKEHELHGRPHLPRQVFRSSGTVGGVQRRAEHALAYPELVWARSQAFAQSILGSWAGYHLLALLPSYLDRGESSLLAMLDGYLKSPELIRGNYYNKEYRLFSEDWKAARRQGQSVLAWGIPYALMEWCEQVDFEPGLGDILIETGGTKGMPKAWTEEDRRAFWRKKLGSTLRLGGEYGMTELGSQAYQLEGSPWAGYVFPPMVGVGIYRVDDPLEWEKPGAVGGLCLVDPANYYGVSFVQTQDLGRILEDGSLALLGRMGGAEPRGCNLLYFS